MSSHWVRETHQFDSKPIHDAYFLCRIFRYMPIYPYKNYFGILCLVCKLWQRCCYEALNVLSDGGEMSFLMGKERFVKFLSRTPNIILFSYGDTSFEWKYCWSCIFGYYQSMLYDLLHLRAKWEVLDLSTAKIFFLYCLQKGSLLHLWRLPNLKELNLNGVLDRLEEFYAFVPLVEKSLKHILHSFPKTLETLRINMGGHNVLQPASYYGVSFSYLENLQVLDFSNSAISFPWDGLPPRLAMLNLGGTRIDRPVHDWKDVPLFLPDTLLGLNLEGCQWFTPNMLSDLPDSLVALNLLGIKNEVGYQLNQLKGFPNLKFLMMTTSTLIWDLANWNVVEVGNFPPNFMHLSIEVDHPISRQESFQVKSKYQRIQRYVTGYNFHMRVISSSSSSSMDQSSGEEVLLLTQSEDEDEEESEYEYEEDDLLECDYSKSNDGHWYFSTCAGTRSNAIIESYALDPDHCQLCFENYSKPTGNPCPCTLSANTK